MLRERLPQFFEREKLSHRREPQRTQRKTEKAQGLEGKFVPQVIADYDFSPSAHLRVSEIAESREILPAVLPAFAVKSESQHGTASDAQTVKLGLSAEVRNELKSVETELKFAGYLQQQQRAMDRLKKAETRHIPEWFDYANVSGLSREMNEKLTRVRPQTIGQALNIPGVTPAAASLINIFIEIQGKQKAAASG